MAISRAARSGPLLPLVCYTLLVAACLLDLFTPQLFIAAILLNGPIALSSIALRQRLTTNLVILAQIANAFAGYLNGVQAGFHWDSVAVGDRLLLAASFVLVGYLSVRTQDFAREAGVSAGRRRQVEIEKALREATGRVRGSLNVELVQRGILRESMKLLGATRALLVVREATFETPLMLSIDAADGEVAYDRRLLPTELATLVARARDTQGVFAVTSDDALGRLTLEWLRSRQAMATAIGAGESGEYTLIECEGEERPFAPDARQVLQSFAEQAETALEQARLFSQLGAQNEEIAHQKDELAHRGDVIRDIVYALAHDLRTPLAATDTTIKQALAGAYGELPDRYKSVLRTTLAANDDERRIVETLLLVARYEAGEESNIREPVDVDALIVRVAEDLQPVAEASGAILSSKIEATPLWTMGDPNELRRAVVNLVANAIEATPRGSHVLVRASRKGNDVDVCVEDEGYGVPEDRRASLFQRFGSARAGAGSGTGLGLYIVRRIAEKHGGKVSYAPREPRGSVFAIALPYGEE